MNLTIFVGTCDAYDVLWDNFTTCLKKYWPYETEVIFAGETKEHPEYKTVTPGLDITWGKRMALALEEVKTDYIFFLLEDYFLSHQYPESSILTYIDDMTKMNMNKLQISRSSGQSYIGTNDTYLQFTPHSGYTFSVQPSLWRTSWVKQNMLHDYSPADFEVKNTDKYKGHVINTYIDASINFPVYFNAVRRGFKKSEGWESFRLQQGLKEF